MIEVAPTTEQTLHALYRDHNGWLQNWLKRRLGNAWDAADLSQDTFLRVLASAQPLAEVHEPRAYLLTVGKRLLSNLRPAQPRTGLFASVGAVARREHAFA